MPKTTKSVKKCKHDYENLKRCGRADWRCPKCGDDVMLELAVAYEAGVDLTKNSMIKNLNI